MLNNTSHDRFRVYFRGGGGGQGGAFAPPKNWFAPPRNFVCCSLKYVVILILTPCNIWTRSICPPLEQNSEINPEICHVRSRLYILVLGTRKNFINLAPSLLYCFTESQNLDRKWSSSSRVRPSGLRSGYGTEI